MAEKWPGLKLINGRPRHPQSQGSVERSNGALKNSLIAWMRDNNTSSWSKGLPIIQWSLNTTWHEGIKVIPYTALFGTKPMTGLASNIPSELLENVTNGITEEDFEQLCNNEEDASGNENLNDSNHQTLNIEVDQ